MSSIHSNDKGSEKPLVLLKQVVFKFWSSRAKLLLNEVIELFALVNHVSYGNSFRYVFHAHE